MKKTCYYKFGTNLLVSQPIIPHYAVEKETRKAKAQVFSPSPMNQSRLLRSAPF